MEIGVFFYVLLGFTSFNIAYYVYISKVGFSQTDTPQGDVNKVVSLIVCSKNEQENLKILIPKLLKQSHTNFELIIVNDASHDDTKDIIEEFMKHDPRVKMVHVLNNESFWGNKKYALTLGIKKAVNDSLVFIDADCTPNSADWLSLMSRHLSKEKSIVLGYGGYQKVKNSLLNALIRFETGFTAIQYFSYAMRGNPYMGVGRNLSYTATLFYSVNGFINHMNVLGGDDDLFVNQVATSKNTAVSLEESSFTYSKPEISWAAWWRQKKRHINTANHYRQLHKYFLGFFYLTQIGFLISSVLALTFATNWIMITVLIIIIIRYLVFWVVIGRGLSRFRESDIIVIIPFLELLLIGTQLALFIKNMMHPPKQWK
jgi:glycosyltransferase involved in cell wall biosynthesis